MYKGPDLAGRCGIPDHGERTPVAVETVGGGQLAAEAMPRVITWSDGRRFLVKGVSARCEFGREVFGNLVVRYLVEVGSYHSIRELWYDMREGWFVRRR